jgi:hypothetical protein
MARHSHSMLHLVRVYDLDGIAISDCHDAPCDVNLDRGGRKQE